MGRRWERSLDGGDGNDTLFGGVEDTQLAVMVQTFLSSLLQLRQNWIRLRTFQTMTQ